MIRYTIIFITAFAIRIGYALTNAAHMSADALVYDGLARQIAQQGVFSVQTLMKFPLKDHPVYPFFVGVQYALFGPDHLPVWIAQAVIGSLLCLLVAITARELFGDKISLTAGYIAAGYPVYVKLSSMMLSEGLFAFLCVLFLLLIVIYSRKLRCAYVVWAGLVFGITVLTRSVILPFGAVIAVFMFLRNRSRLSMKTNCVHQVVFVAVFVCTILPWSIRNYIVSGGQIIPVTEATDRGLYISFCPVDGKIFGIRPDNDPVMVEARTISSFEQRRKFFLSKTAEFIRNNPLKVAKLEILKFAYLWSPFDWEILGGGSARYNYGFVFILPFFVYGSLRMIRNRATEAFILFLPILYFQFIHLIYFALPRFRLGFEHAMIMIAAYGLHEGYSRAQRNRAFVAKAGCFLIINVLLWFFSADLKNAIRWICTCCGLW